MNESEDQIFPLGGQVPVGRKIALEFDSFRDFIREFSPLVSEKGMFVGEAQLAGEPSLVAGDPVQFEVRLSREFWLIRGSGEIVWRRGSDDPTGPPGVAVRFKDLDEPSQRLVSRLVSNRVKEGGALFDLEATPRPAPTPPVMPEPMETAEADALFEGGELAESEVEDEAPLLPVRESPSDEVDAGALFSVDSIPELPEVPVADAVGVEAGRPEDVIDVPGRPEAGPGEPMPLPESPEEPLPQELAEPVGEEEIDVPLVTHREIAQMAEEISGVTAQGGAEGEEEEEESSSVMAARAAAVKPERSPWLWLAVASLVGVAVGVVFFFYFGRIKSLFVPGEKQIVESVAMVESPAETADVAPAAEETEISEGEAPDSTPPEATADHAAEGGVPEATPSGEPVEAVPDAEVTAQLPPATRVNRITWREQNGATAVVLHLDGGLSEESYEVTRVRGGAPREVVKVIGIREPFQPRVLEVGDSRIQQIRTGLHQTERGSELHIVVDLASPETAVKRTRIRENTLVVVFS
jgi:hypothetical protein